MILRRQRGRKFSTLMALTILLLAGVTAVSLYRVRSQWGERLNRKDIVIDRKIASPNGRKLLIDYRFDLGALGYSATREVVVPVEQMGGRDVAGLFSAFVSSAGMLARTFPVSLILAIQFASHFSNSVFLAPALILPSFCWRLNIGAVRTSWMRINLR